MDIPMLKGGNAGRTEVDTAFLGDKVKTRTLRDAVIMYEANKRVGTHDTLTRAEVARAKKPLFKQKHTGRARVKHQQVTQCRGGGRAHGPKPRDYSYRMPTKQLRVALQSALLSKFRDGQVSVVDGIALATPKTKTMLAVLTKLNVAASCLFVIDAADKNIVLSARNLRRVKVSTVADLNAYDVLLHRSLVLTEKALAKLQEVNAHA